MEEVSRNLVILGANSDLGSELMRCASMRKGTNILAVSRSATQSVADCSRTVQRLEGIDLTRQRDLEALAAAVDRMFEGPFAVIHSIGNFWIHKPLVDTPFSEIVQMVESQFITLIGTARFLTPLMQSRKGGRFVAFSCNSVGYNYPDMSPFTASKAAIESFVKCYANEHSEFGISACALALPTIRTPKVLIEKTTGDHANYITPQSLAAFILDHVLSVPHEMNGNVIKVFKHSPTFYHSSYYDRNPRSEKQSDQR